MQKYPDIFVRGFLLTVVIDRDWHVSQTSPHIFYKLATHLVSSFNPKWGFSSNAKTSALSDTLNNTTHYNKHTEIKPEIIWPIK